MLPQIIFVLRGINLLRIWLLRFIFCTFLGLIFILFETFAFARHLLHYDLLSWLHRFIFRRRLLHDILLDLLLGELAEIFQFRILLQRLEKILSDKVAFDHGCRIFNETTKVFPCRLGVVLPLHLEFHPVFVTDSGDAMASDALNFVPACILGLFGLLFWRRSHIESVNLLNYHHLLLVMVLIDNIALFSSLS